MIGYSGGIAENWLVWEKNTFADQKCFVRVVKETHRKEGHNRAELGFSQHKKEKKSVFLFSSHTAFFTIAQNCNQSKQSKYLLLGGWIIKLLDIHIEELYTSIKKRTNKR